MMESIRIFYWEGLSVFALAAVSLAWRALLHRRVLAGLVQDKQRRVSVLRVQLLVLTVLFAVRYLWDLGVLVEAGGHQDLPAVGAGWVAALGVSCGVYLVGEFLAQQ